MSRAPTAQLVLQQQLAGLEAKDLLRRRRVQTLPCGPATLSEDKPLLAFASNDYLGLANSPALIAATQEAATRWGVGSGASHLVSGHTEAHEALDRALADFVGCEAALSFSTGYLANLAVMPSLLGRGDAILRTNSTMLHWSMVHCSAGLIFSAITISTCPCWQVSLLLQPQNTN